MAQLESLPVLLFTSMGLGFHPISFLGKCNVYCVEILVAIYKAFEG